MICSCITLDVVVLRRTTDTSRENDGKWVVLVPVARRRTRRGMRGPSGRLCATCIAGEATRLAPAWTGAVRKKRDREPRPINKSCPCARYLHVEGLTSN